MSTEVRCRAALSGRPAGDVEQKQILPFLSRTPSELYLLETWPSGHYFEFFMLAICQLWELNAGLLGEVSGI